MSRSNSNPEMQDIARHLLAYESAERTPSARDISAVVRVSEKLRRPLCMLAGVTGFRSLLSRALTLAKRENLGINAVSVKPDGSLDGLNGLRDDDLLDGGAALIAQMLALLVAFVGESLTLSIVHEVWPELSVDDTNSGRQDQHDPTR